jgi:NADH-quinone oxidoreductase subunit H
MREWLHLPGDIFTLPSLLVTLIQFGAFMAKLAFFCWLQIMIRWTVPRFRYDQLINLGWKILLPIALANVLVTALLILIFQAK